MSTPASRNRSVRAADTDRIQVAHLLTEAAAQGRLQMSEYEDRLTKAYAAQTYGELARLLGLPHPEGDLDQAVLVFKHWLRTERGWLLIFDNADDPALLKPFLPDA